MWGALEALIWSYLKAKGPKTPFVIPLLLASAFSLLSTLKCFADRSNATGTFAFPLSRQKNTIQLKQRHLGSLAFPLMENEQQLRQQNFMKSRFRRVCVFCGSSPGKNPSYQLAAIQLGKQLVLPTSSRFPFLWNLFTAWFKWKKDELLLGLCCSLGLVPQNIWHNLLVSCLYRSRTHSLIPFF